MSRGQKVVKGREFKVDVDGGEAALRFRRPTQRELFEVDLAYRAAMTRLLKANVMTSHSATRMFQESGDWTKRDEQEMRNAAIMIATLSNDLEENGDKRSREESARVAEKITEARSRQFEMINRKNDLFSSCAENLAEQSKMHVLALLCCVRASDDQPFFKDEDSYQEFARDNPEAASKIFAEAYAFDYGVDVSELGKDWAEVKFFREDAERERARKAAEEHAAEELEAEDAAAEAALGGAAPGAPQAAA